MSKITHTPEYPLRRNKTSQSGYALVVALLLIALFAVVVGEFVRQSYIEGLAAENRLQMRAAKLALDGAEERALAVIMQQHQEVASKRTASGDAIIMDDYIAYGQDWNNSYESNTFSITRGSTSEDYKCRVAIRISDESARIPLKTIFTDKEAADTQDMTDALRTAYLTQDKRVKAMLKALEQELKLGGLNLGDRITQWENENKRELQSPFELLAVLNEKEKSDNNRYLVFGGLDNRGDPYPGLAEYISTDCRYQYTINGKSRAYAVLKGYLCSQLMLKVIFAAAQELTLKNPEKFDAREYAEKPFAARANPPEANQIPLAYYYSVGNIRSYQEISQPGNQFFANPFSQYYRIEISASCGSAKASRTAICRTFTFLPQGAASSSQATTYLEVVNRLPVRCFTNPGEYPTGFIEPSLATRKPTTTANKQPTSN